MMLPALISAPPAALAWQVNGARSFISVPPSSASTDRRYSSSSSTLTSAIGRLEKLQAVSAAQEKTALPESGLALQLFEELKKDEFLVPVAPHVSLARQNYCDPVEAAVNEHINVEYTASYAYHALYAYFDRDNVALNGFARFFKKSSEEERQHAEKLMQYQNKRGGKVKLLEIKAVPSEFEHVEKGDALHAMELALSLEKLTNERLLGLRSIAEKNDDPHLVEFIESEFLSEQVESIKKISDYVTQLRMVGKGLGVWEFDQRVLGGAN